ncbi:MAG: crosslink repair DNA glycosylase YcaQ family protein [Chitinophagaceae bacterium]
MQEIVLSKQEARAIILHAAGLTKKAQFGKGIEAAFKVIDHLGFLQVDTNYVVERAHHHAIAARVPDYKIAWLEELQQDGRIYEFWTRESGFMPMEEFRFSLAVQNVFANRYKDVTAQELNIMNRVLDRIAREGPLGVKDFDNDRTVKSTGWWDWRPSKIALERLHLSGRLLTTRKKDFHKLYDLPGNIIPVDTNKTEPSIEEFTKHLIVRSLQAMGIASQKEISWNARFVKPPVKQEIKKMIEAGEVLEVKVEDLKGPFYMLPAYKKKKISIAGDAFILSPFDMLNVFRHRLREFFDFDYQVECFVPAPKRKYGYFSLPVLIGENFVARMDAKAERKQKQLIIHNLHFEKVKLTADNTHKLIDAISVFAHFNGCNTITAVKSNNKAILKMINTGKERKR